MLEVVSIVPLSTGEHATCRCIHSIYNIIHIPIWAYTAPYAYIALPCVAKLRTQKSSTIGAALGRPLPLLGPYLTLVIIPLSKVTVAYHLCGSG